MANEDIKAAREQYEDDHFTKEIYCPEHPPYEVRDHHDPEQLHYATLYTQGHRYAGIWECPITGDTDTHEHSDYEIEEVEVPDSHPDRTDGHSYQVYVCGGLEGCGVAIPLEEADPAQDVNEARVDSQIDEMRGK
jgi:hypothetical protein